MPFALWPSRSSLYLWPFSFRVHRQAATLFRRGDVAPSTGCVLYLRQCSAGLKPWLLRVEAGVSCLFVLSPRLTARCDPFFSLFMGPMEGASEGKGIFPPLVSLIQYLGRICLQSKCVDDGGGKGPCTGFYREKRPFRSLALDLAYLSHTLCSSTALPCPARRHRATTRRRKRCSRTSKRPSSTASRPCRCWTTRASMSTCTTCCRPSRPGRGPSFRFSSRRDE